MKRIDVSKTIEQLESEDWGPPTYGSSLVKTIHRLRKKPLKEFSDEDLRICIGQQMAIPLLVPIALDRLAQSPFIECDFYKGDLLQSVAGVDREFWCNHPRYSRRFEDILTKAKSELQRLSSVEQKIAIETIDLGLTKVTAA